MEVTATSGSQPHSLFFMERASNILSKDTATDPQVTGVPIATLFVSSTAV